MTFKEQLKADVQNVFLDTELFADEHNINGKQMKVLIDNSELIERAKISGTAATDGTYTASILIFVASAELGPKPLIGSLMSLDGREFRVINCTDEFGIYSIELRSVRM